MKINGLTKANVRKLNIDVREDLDFTDDGSRFRGFAYKGMPITQCKYQGTIYLAIRVDYLKNDFTYEDWRKTEEWKMCDKFNGVSEIDTDDLIATLERIIVKVEEMNKAAATENIDLTEVKIKMYNEVEYAEDLINKLKDTWKWYDASDYQLREIRECLKNTERNIESAKKKILQFNNLSIKEKRELFQRSEKNVYLIINPEGYFLKKIKEELA